MKLGIFYTIRILLILFTAGMFAPCAKGQAVDAIEYFFDVDPGIGNGLKINLNAAAQIDTTVNFDMSSLSAGLHQLFIRARDANNHWSLYHTFPVLKGAGRSPVLLQKMEYYFDTDPGPGNGFAISLSAVLQTDTTVLIDLSPLTDGIHQVFFRVMDNLGNWSHYQASSVIKGPGYYQPLTVNQVEYFIDDDPGLGKGTPLAIGPNGTIDASYLLSIPNTIDKDSIRVSFRARDNRGLWGLYYDTTVAVTCDLFVFKSYVDFAAAACGNRIVTFTDTTTAAQWKWKFGNGDSASGQQVVYTFNRPGTYNVDHYLINKRGCISDTITNTIVVQPPLAVNAGPDKEVYPGDVVTLIPAITGNDSSYLWTPNIYISNNTMRNPTFTGVTDTKYIITVTGKGNCTATDTVMIKINTSARPVSVPNAFSPNGDGVNDNWLIRYLNTYPNCLVQVFNRYGQMVFETHGYSSPWDGRYKGKPLPAGTYYYIINLNDGQKARTGSVSILF